MEIDFRSLGSSTIETEKFFWSWLIYDSTEKIASDRSNHKDITNFGYNSGDNKNNNNYYYLSSLRTLTQGQCDQIEPLMAIWATLWSLWEFIGPNRPKSIIFRVKTATTIFFIKMGHSRPLFHYFRLFNTVDSICSIYFLPITGFKPRTSGIGSDRSTNWATSTATTIFGRLFIQPYWSPFSRTECEVFNVMLIGMLVDGHLWLLYGDESKWFA